MYLLIFFVTLALKLVDAFRGCSSFKRMPMVSFFFFCPCYVADLRLRFFLLRLSLSSSQSASNVQEA